jgi:hypothetical protein
MKESVKDDKEVLFRLHNNTNCNIEIVTAGSYAVTKKADGATTTNIPEDEEVIIKYGFEVDGKIRLLNMSDAEDDVAISVLTPNRSVSFSVPMKYFKKKWQMFVPFKYDWEVGTPSPGKSNIIHRIYLDSRGWLQRPTKVVTANGQEK